MPPALQSLFELSKREARIDSQKCTFGIGSLQRGILTATCSKAVAQNSEQRFSLFASGNTNHAFRAGQLHQFPCLSYIALHQKQKLGRPSRSVFASLVAFDCHVTRQQRQDFLRRNFLADTSHP